MLTFHILIALLGPALGHPPSHPVLALHIRGAFDYQGTNGMPVFVLYDDGVAIYRTRTPPGDYPRYASAKLSTEVTGELLSIATSKAFMALDSTYDLAPESNDQPLYIMRVWADGREKVVRVRGFRPNEPQTFWTLVARLSTFHTAGSQPWFPDSVRVTLVRVDSSCAQFTPSAWPSRLPAPSFFSDSQLRLVHYSVPIQLLHRVQSLRKQYGGWDCTPVTLGHRYWQVWYEYPFPADTLWSREWSHEWLVR